MFRKAWEPNWSGTHDSCRVPCRFLIRSLKIVNQCRTFVGPHWRISDDGWQTDQSCFPSLTLATRGQEDEGVRARNPGSEFSSR